MSDDRKWEGTDFNLTLEELADSIQRRLRFDEEMRELLDRGWLEPGDVPQPFDPLDTEELEVPK